MKTSTLLIDPADSLVHRLASATTAFIGATLLAFSPAASAQPEPPPPPRVATSIAVAGAGGATASAEAGANGERRRIVVRGIEPGSLDSSNRPEVTWLGVGVEEVTPALAAQLNLQSGEGLVVTYVSTNSPAAEAVQKNDVLVKLDGQLLVHPAQLRKLVQAHKEGDTVELVFFRKGKQESATVKLAKIKTGFSLFGDERGWQGDLRELKLKALDTAEIGQALRREAEVLRKSLTDSGITSENFRTEIRRGVEEARKAMEEAIRNSSNAGGGFRPGTRILKEFSRRGPIVDDDTRVTLRKESREVKTMVKTDESGTCVLVATPQKHLTVTDPDGKVLFEGPVDSPEQQDKVPRDAWKKAQSMLEEMSRDKAPASQDPEADDVEEPEVDL